MPAPVGRVRPAERRRQRHDRHRRAGERQRRRDGDADVRRRGARDAARGLLAPVPGHRRRRTGTWARAARRRRSTAGARSWRRPPRSASSCSTPPPTQLEADRDDLELADGAVRVKGSPERSVSIADLAGEIGTVHGKGSGEVPEAPDRRHRRLRRAARERDVPRAAADHPGRAREGRPRDRRRPGAARSPPRTTPGVILNRRGADGQVYGGVVMGVGLALSRGHDARRRGPPAEPAPARLQARDVLRRARDRGRLDPRSRRRAPARAARRAWASRRRSRPPARSRTRSRRCSARRCAGCR